MKQDFDGARIAEAVRKAEAGTSAELVCVLARRSAEPAAATPLAIAAVAAFLAAWAQTAFTLWSAERILLGQLAVFAAVLLVLSFGPLRRRLVPRREQRRRAHQAAAEQFLVRGLSRKADRTGVLVFVSLAERYARVIADDGVAQKLDDKVWREAIDILVRHARENRVTDGFVEAIGLCGRVLAKEFPPVAGEANELSDRFHVI